MKEYTISAAESGQKCISFCKHILPKAQNGFLYKMLRKKNITLNGKKADAATALQTGDIVRFYFADETFAMLQDAGNVPKEQGGAKSEKPAAAADVRERILYEDEDILIWNKPAGVLSQKAKPEDISANELLLDYLHQQNAASRGFVPSVANRLDRNTSGALLFGKSYRGSRLLSGLLQSRDLAKYYRCLVLGKMQAAHLKGRLIKDEKTNTVTVWNEENAAPKRGALPENADYIETEFVPLQFLTIQTGDAAKGAAPGDTAKGAAADGGKLSATLLEVHLITGKPHQIRAHLASVGHPILGDPKYGKDAVNRLLKKQFAVHRQLLHAYRVEFPALPEDFVNLSARTFTAPLPEDMTKILQHQ